MSTAPIEQKNKISLVFLTHCFKNENYWFLKKFAFFCGKNKQIIQNISYTQFAGDNNN